MQQHQRFGWAEDKEVDKITVEEDNVADEEGDLSEVAKEIEDLEDEVGANLAEEDPEQISITLKRKRST